VSGPGGRPAREPARYPGLLAALMAAVRPEFRGSVLSFDPRDPVFGAPACLVSGCERPGRKKGLCTWHYEQWFKGRTGFGTFIASASPEWRPKMVPEACLVPGCGYSGRAYGLCETHYGRYRSAGKPGPGPWAAGQPPVPQPEPLVTCLVRSCGLWARRDGVLCHAHALSWSRNGRPDAREFAAGYDDESRLRRDRIDLRGLGPQLRLEWQYAFQCRSDAGQEKVRPEEARRAVSAAAAAGVTSLLDWDEDQWRRHRAPGVRTFRSAAPARALVIYARRQAEGLAFGCGWDTEYPRDTWRLRNLGIDNHAATIQFAGIPQPWLKDLAKRWCRHRLASGISAGEPARATRIIARFGAWLAGPDVNVTSAAGITRPLLERYLAGLHAVFGGRKLHREHAEHLGAFLAAVRRHGWEPALPATAAIFPEDYPKQGQKLPRALAGHVMAQVEDPANLGRWDNPACRLITVILIRCGLRVSSAVTLDWDCVVTDDAGAPYLRYWNTKMKREALVPADEDITAMIAAQRDRVRRRWPDGTPVLFPRPTRNVNGTRHTGTGTYRDALYQWLERCDIRNEHGQPVHLTPHQWRHTLGTALINRDVPQHVVQKILDHDSPLMTAHYARLSDKTVREHWERARKVDAEGRPVQISPDGPLGDAAWAKQRLSRATQALPNGYCQLPLVKTCPHANSCLTCPMFATTADFLPQHHAQRQQTLQIITAAEAAGHARVAEMNKQVAGNLDKIIAVLESEGPDGREAAPGAS
jgi:integrase